MSKLFEIKFLKNLIMSNNNNIELSRLVKNLNIKTNHYEFQEAKYSNDDIDSNKKLVWVLLFGKHSKNNNVFRITHKVFTNNVSWDYAIMIDNKMKIIDIYEDYSVIEGGIINGVPNKQYNGKTLIDGAVKDKIEKRNALYEKNNERMEQLTRKISYSRWN